MNKNIDMLPFDGLLDEKHYLFACDLNTNISRWSKNAVDLFGLPGEYMENADTIWVEHIHPSDRDAYIQDVSEVLSGKKSEHNIDYRAQKKDGEYVSVTCKGRVVDNASGDGKVFLGFIENHTVSSHIDSITGLHNFFSFVKDMSTLKSNDLPLTFLLIGINRFTDINNTYGYNIGNKLLWELGNSLTDYKHVNYIYRLDGTKFCIMLNTTDKDIISKLYNKIRNNAQKGIKIDNNCISFTISGGAFIVNDICDPYALQSVLFASLDESKTKKHSELVFFDDQYIGNIQQNIALLEIMRSCVYNNMYGFYMCYQPIVDVRTNTICGTEALVRWSHPEYGNVSPGIFIPILENDPCFYQLSNWIMETSLAETKQLIEKYPDFIVHVNVSAEQFEVSNFRDSVKQILLKTGFPSKNLCIELTERVVSLNPAFLKVELGYFRSLGVKISLDDFGTGVNSLNLLLDLPIDELKIERMFVKDILENTAQQSIVKSISTCANELGLDVCVEGVETEEIKDYLKRYQISQHQGYYYSRPIIISDFVKLVT